MPNQPQLGVFLLQHADLGSSSVSGKIIHNNDFADHLVRDGGKGFANEPADIAFLVVCWNDNGYLHLTGFRSWFYWRIGRL